MATLPRSSVFRDRRSGSRHFPWPSGLSCRFGALHSAQDSRNEKPTLQTTCHKRRSADRLPIACRSKLGATLGQSLVPRVKQTVSAAAAVVTHDNWPASCLRLRRLQRARDNTAYHNAASHRYVTVTRSLSRPEEDRGPCGPDLVCGPGWGTPRSFCAHGDHTRRPLLAIYMAGS